MAQTYFLHDDRIRRFALDGVRKARLGMEVVIDAPRRNLEQNKRLHAMLADVADQIGWPPDTGEVHDLEWWKRRTTLQWLIDSKEPYEIITPLEEMEGDAPSFAILLPHTSHLKVPQVASYIEWLFSFGAKNGVVWTEPEREDPPPPEERR